MKKLDYRFTRPYKIISYIGELGSSITYKLDLPKALGLYNRKNAFYCLLL